MNYERVRRSGLYNMITESAAAMKAMGLDSSSNADCERYLRIISRYGKLKNKYGK